MSSPRRFGKSLTIDTIAQLFAGNRELFTGLYAEENWQWDTQYPVLRISFGGGASSENNQSHYVIADVLQSLEEQWELIPNRATYGGRSKIYSSLLLLCLSVSNFNQ